MQEHITRPLITHRAFAPASRTVDNRVAYAARRRAHIARQWSIEAVKNHKPSRQP